ncbi:uncharacterized protein LOC110841622 [Folsomia candida]|uniref:uncharacterized protein LOC110841622 n=1 Tax=Folsomia candida TaxID=158441 RepID=UPI00160519D5|nr:uncharacterized protein LOC110841622 [Folsomia candida]XP_035702570.1 uncharacterized protein LOC110841622 [Folsomia candida]
MHVKLHSKFFQCDADVSRKACKKFYTMKCSSVGVPDDRVSSEKCISIWENLDCDHDLTEIGHGTLRNDNTSSLKINDGSRKWVNEKSFFMVCENNCILGGFKCGNKRCINTGSMCNEKNCTNSDDEIMCYMSKSEVYPKTTEEIHEITISPSESSAEEGQKWATQDKSDTIPGTNCSSNETYCETDGKCILISNVSNCVEADVKNNGWNPGDPGVLTFVVIGIAVFTLIGICIAVFVKKKKKKSKRSRSDIPLPPIHQELQLLLPSPHPVFPLTPPWKSNPSLICLSLLGEGFFGKVYQVEDQAAIISPTCYAIKCIDMKKTLRNCSGTSTTSSTTSAQSTGSVNLNNYMTTLVNEMQIMDQLSSDQVVRYYGCWAEAEDCSQLVLTKSRLEEYIHELIANSNNSVTSTQNSPLSHIFIKMELCHTTLKNYLQAYPEQVGDEISIVQQVATGLLYVHSKGYIHRDIKPGNIFCKVEESSGKLTWKIGDFGLAVMSTEGGNVGVAGTYRYQSPEMRKHSRYTLKTDLYSLGLVWVEILYRNSDKSAVFEKVRGFNGIERRKYLNTCCLGKFKNVVKIVDLLLISEPDSRICSGKLCNLLKSFNANEVSIII